MVLSARFLELANVNSWRPLAQAQMVQGDATTLYFQLLDSAAMTAGEGFNPAGRRYCPPAGSTLQVTLLSLDSNKQVVRAATQPFATLDASIWALSMLATDTIEGTISVLLQLTEPGPVVRRGHVASAVMVQAQNPAAC